DVVLYLEDVIHLAIVSLRPEVVALGGADELGRDAYLVAASAHRTLEHVGHVQLSRDLRDLDSLTLEREGRGARRHLELWNLRQQIEQFLRDTIGEVSLVLGLRHVHKRQHRDRVFGNRSVLRRPMRYEVISYARH